MLASLGLLWWQHCQFQCSVLFPHSQYYVAFFLSCSSDDASVSNIEGRRQRKEDDRSITSRVVYRYVL